MASDDVCSHSSSQRMGALDGGWSAHLPFQRRSRILCRVGLRNRGVAFLVGSASWTSNPSGTTITTHGGGWTFTLSLCAAGRWLLWQSCWGWSHQTRRNEPGSLVGEESPSFCKREVSQKGLFMWAKVIILIVCQLRHGCALLLQGIIVLPMTCCPCTLTTSSQPWLMI